MGAMAKIAILALEGVQPGSRIRSQGFGSENPLRIQRFPRNCVRIVNNSFRPSRRHAILLALMTNEVGKPDSKNRLEGALQ